MTAVLSSSLVLLQVTDQLSRLMHGKSNVKSLVSGILGAENLAGTRLSVLFEIPDADNREFIESRLEQYKGINNTSLASYSLCSRTSRHFISGLAGDWRHFA